ncbi:hypothetical protein bcere0024_021960 [Bacillus cereus Rock4-18]|nr:hypothetical protein bcere0024_021960 [Bacillus cereus Rock4-18]
MKKEIFQCPYRVDYEEIIRLISLHTKKEVGMIPTSFFIN